MKILFLGDVMLGRTLNEVLEDYAAEYPWGDTLPILRGADLRMCNLECVISDRGEPWPKKMFVFRTDAKNIRVLKIAGMDVVANANNHALDFGSEALQDMNKTLDAAGIAHAGAGEDLAAASAPTFLERQGLRLAFLSFTDNEPGWEAGKNKPGVFFVPLDTKDGRAKRLFDLVKQAKSKSDLLVVSAHWGGNWGYAPDAPHPEFAHSLIEAGADIIFGHSCHVFRGIEIYKGKPIIYGAGDFIDDYAVDEAERNDRSCIFIVGTDGSRIKNLQLMPTVIRDYQARLADQSEAKIIADKMRDLCLALGTASRWDNSDRALEIAV